MNDDDDAMVVSVDSIKPWTIKAMPTEVRNMVVSAARDENLTASQWLERVIRERCAEGGRQVAAQNPRNPGVSAADVVAVMTEARAVAEASGLPLPKALARDWFALAREVARAARGAAPLTKRLAKPT